MFFSVVVPCYNVEDHISSLLHAVTSQMDDQCELILVDDGSTDHTIARVKDFLATYAGPAQVVLKEFPNAGAAKARERGLALARGEFIHFCDSDDVFQPGFIDTLRRYLVQYPETELMFFSSDMAAEVDGALVRLRSKVHYPQVMSFRSGAELLEWNLKQEMYSAAVWTFVIRRRLVQRFSVIFTPRSAHEDHLFTLQAIFGARFILAIPDLLYVQRVRVGSLTQSSKKPSYLVDRIGAFDEADAYLARHAGAGLRRLYAKWSHDAIAGIVRENRGLRRQVLVNGTGARYFLKASLRSLRRKLGLETA